MSQSGSVITVSATDTDTTYNVVSTTADGLAPQLPSPHGGKFLKADGTWVVPPDNDTTYSAGTGISISGTTINCTVTDTDTTYNVVSTSADGLAPQLPSSHGGKFLKADGTWVVPPDNDTTYTAGTGISISGTTINCTVTDTNTNQLTTWDVANSGGTGQFTVAHDEQVRFAGSGAASVAFDENTQKITISSTDTTYATSVVDSSNDAIIRLTGSDSSMDDVKLVAGSNISLTPSGDNITIASTDTDTTYTAGSGLDLSGIEFSLDDPINLLQLTASTDATDDKILLWDESGDAWKYMTLDDLQDSIDTGGGGGGSGHTIRNEGSAMEPRTNLDFAGELAGVTDHNSSTDTTRVTIDAKTSWLYG